MKIKEKKDKILLIIQEQLPLSYREIKDVYNITESYDAILELNTLALKYNKPILELAYFFYGGKDRGE